MLITKSFSLNTTMIVLLGFGFQTQANEAEKAKARDLILATGIKVENFSGPGNFDGLGRVADTDIYYGHSCASSYSGTLVLVRAVDGKKPQVWKYDETCVRKIAWRDIDGGGKPEIRASSFAGGSGTLQVSEIFYRWPSSDAQPSEITRFVSNSYSSWGGAYRKYGFEPENFHNFEFRENRFLPVGAMCPSEDECALVERKTFCIATCDEEIPKNITQEAGWAAFIQALAADGYQSGNLQPTEDVPKVTQEVQDAFDTWLSD